MRIATAPSRLFCRRFIMLLLMGMATVLHAQKIEPLIAEYTGRAAGSFEVTNTTPAPAVVVFEPRSFSIAADGTGQFRALDPSIHLELSAGSVRLEPNQSARIFYKVTTENTSAWLCVYATFSPVKKTPGINVRIMLPHTIYLYQKQPLMKDDIRVDSVRYDPATHRVLCELTNDSTLVGRAASVEVSGEHSSATGNGFPMLPHSHRVLAVDWSSPHPPRTLVIDFPRFSLKLPIAASGLLVAAE